MFYVFDLYNHLALLSVYLEILTNSIGLQFSYLHTYFKIQKLLYEKKYYTNKIQGVSRQKHLS